MGKTAYKEENLAYFERMRGEGGYRLMDGILVKEIERGEGTVCPRMSDVVLAHYSGKLINGQVFDSTEGEQIPACFRVRDLIEGWQIALTHMHAGDKWEIIVPARLGYGSMRLDGIPANSTLVFTLHLIKIA